MKRMRAALVVLLLMAVSRVAWADLAALLPDNTIVVVRAPSMPELIRAYDRSPMGAMLRDPAAKRLLDPVKKEWAGAQGRVVARRSVNNSEWRGFATGDAMLAAIAAPGSSKKGVQWVLLAEHGAEGGVMDALRAGPKPARGRIEKKEEPAGALTYTRLRFVREVEAKIPGGPQGGPDALKQVSDEYDEYVDGSVVVFAPAEGGAVRGVVERLGRIRAGERLKPPALISAARTGQAQVFVDIGRLSGLFDRHEKIKPVEALVFDPRALGLGGMKAAAAVDLRPDGVNVDIAIDAPARRTGLAKILFLQNTLTTGTAGIVPANTIAYGALGYPLAQGWRAFNELLAGASPATAVTLASQIEAIRQATGHDLNADLFGNLGDVFSRFIAGEGGGKTIAERSTYLVRVRDEAVFRGGLEALLAHLSQGMGMYQIVRDEYLGHAVWGLRPGRPGVVTRTEPVFWISISNGWAVVGTRAEAVRATLRHIERKTQAGSLADSGEFRAAMAALPAVRQGEWYVHLGASSPLITMAPPIKTLAGRIKVDPFIPGEEAGFGPLWNRYFGPAVAARIVDGNRMRIEVRCKGK